MACATTWTVPAAPTNVTATALDANTIQIQWSESSSNVTEFKLSNNGGASFVTAPGSATSYTWGGFAPGSYECIYVVASNPAGDSAGSPFACATTP
jgi:hypothetical protein